MDRGFAGNRRHRELGHIKQRASPAPAKAYVSITKPIVPRFTCIVAGNIGRAQQEQPAGSKKVNRLIQLPRFINEPSPMYSKNRKQKCVYSTVVKCAVLETNGVSRCSSKRY